MKATKCENYVPIYERYDEVLKKKEDWIRKQQDEKKKKQELEDQLADGEMKKNYKILQEHEVESFIKNQMTWIDKKNQALLQKRIVED